MVLVCNRRAEEGHDAVAGILIDRAFEAMDPVGEDREKPIHDLVPLLGIDLLGEIHRALHVREEDGHLFSLALEREARSENLLDQVTWGVRQRRRGRRWQGWPRGTNAANQGSGTFVTEFSACRI